jgi:5-methylcytosine-specific restriction protein A
MPIKCQRPRVSTLQPGRVKLATVSATVRTRGSAWMAMRARILARDCGLCQVCKAAGRFRLARDVDHVQELADGGTDAPGNLQSICGPCHEVKTEAARLARMGQG